MSDCTTRKRCSAGDNCKHPNGPHLTSTDFYKSCHRCKACTAHYHLTHRDERLKKMREYGAIHREEKRAYQRQYRLNNIDIQRKREHEYQKSHRAEASERSRRYRLLHPEKELAHQQRRKARKRNLPNTFTGDDWLKALDYFHGACAYCEKGPSFLDADWVLHADHFVPLNDCRCPGTTKTNILPVCQTCNFNKKDKNPHLWLIERFGKRKAKQIEERIQVYFTRIES